MLAAPGRLRCEYMTNPLGIEGAQSRLCWWPSDGRAAEIQSAYRILASSRIEDLKRGQADVWDSGRVDSSQSVNVVCGGSRPVSGQRVWWKVQTFDSDGVASPWSEIAWFEIGLASANDWRGGWIGADLQGSKDRGAAVPALRRSFEIDSEVACARLYITALGLYRASLNGTRVGDLELAPGWTDYQRRLNYQTFDVTDQLNPGPNVLGVLLGDGWYCGGVGLTGRQCYGDRPALLAQLQVELANGNSLLVITDAQWQWHATEILASDLLDGESVDARQRLGGWDKVGYAADNWRWAEQLSIATPKLTGLNVPAARVVRELNPVGEPSRRRSGMDSQRWIYDFGQNITGRIRLKVKASVGTLICIRHAERLDSIGDLYVDNLRSARATDYYTCAGDPDGELFEPKFTVHGFEYVEISGRFARDAILSVKAQVIGADMETTGEFACDHMLINRLQDNIAWSQRGNYLSVPTDCPQRDERLGWTGSAQVFARTAAFNMDTAAFLNKWLLDMSDAQRSDGSLPPVAPLPPGLDALDLEGGAGFSDALLICSWIQYRCFNDKRALERNYDMLKKFVCGVERRYPSGIRDDRDFADVASYGDWLAPAETRYGDDRTGCAPHELIGTAFYCYSARLLARIAGVLGNLTDLERFETLANQIRSAFRQRFVTPDGRLVDASQTSLVLALHFGLLERAERKHALDMLVADIKQRNTHIATGMLGTPFLLHVLTAGGQLGLAYELLLQTSSPGWLFPVTQGATTIWERWDGWTNEAGFADASMNSFNHCAFGAVGEWLYQTVAGLDLNPDLAPEKNAYRHAHIEPQPPVGKDFPAGPPLRYAEARLDTVHGRFSSRWEITDDLFRLNVCVPTNCTATVVLPDGRSEELCSGDHEFEVRLERDAQIPVLDLNRRVS